MSEQKQDSAYVMPSENALNLTRLIDQDTMLTEKLGLLPEGVGLQEGDQALDVACGPGGWARRLATTYADVEVVGIDVSRDLIDYANAYVEAQQLSNVAFVVADARQQWEFADATFDIVNGRLLFAFLQLQLWEHVTAEMLRVLVPGGLAMLTEIDEVGHSNSPALELYQLMSARALWHMGIAQHPTGDHFGITPLLGRFLQRAGFEDIRQQAYIVDYSAGTAHHRIMVHNISTAFLLLQPMIVRSGEATQPELNELYAQLLEELDRDNFRAIIYFLRVWGRKPY